MPRRLFDRWRRGKGALRRGEVTFGLPEAIVLAIVGLALAVVAVLAQLAPGAQPLG